MFGGDMERGGGGKGRRSSGGFYSSETETEETQWTSWLVPIFVVANVGVFVAAMYINNCPGHFHSDRFEGNCVASFLGRFSFEPLRDNPLFGPSSSTLEKLGALEWVKVVHKHQAWRLVACIWLHAGTVHLLANMFSLVFIGIRLEQQFGFVRVGIIYLLTGFVGSVLSSLFLRNRISVGASGALFGLLGAMLSELITNWSLYTNKVSQAQTLHIAWYVFAYDRTIRILQVAALLTLVVIIAVNLVIGILPHVDNFTHIGGFLAGILLGFVLLPRPQYGWLERHNLAAGVGAKSKYKSHQYVMWLVSLVLLIAGLTGALMMLFRGENGNDHCHWCHYLSCVPTSRWNCDANQL